LSLKELTPDSNYFSTIYRGNLKSKNSFRTPHHIGKFAYDFGLPLIQSPWVHDTDIKSKLPELAQSCALKWSLKAMKKNYEKEIH